MSNEGYIKSEYNSGAHWPEERVQRLVSLVKAGKDGGEIADILGLTRNAVMGKLGRLKLSIRGQKESFLGLSNTALLARKEAAKRDYQRRKANRERKKLLAEQGEAVVDDRAYALNLKIKTQPVAVNKVVFVGIAGTGKPYGLVEQGECRWPLTVGGRVFCCSAPIQTGKVYCAEHCALAYRVVPKKVVSTPMFTEKWRF